MNLVNDLAHHKSNHTSVVRGPHWYLRYHVFKSCSRLKFVFCGMLVTCWTFHLHYSLLLTKFQFIFMLKPYHTFLFRSRTVATFVSAHTFCASRKACFKRHARAGVGIDAIDYTTKYTAKMKAKSAVATILLLKTYQKWFLWCHLPCSFVICIRIFAFLYVKASSKEICEEISCPSFFRKCWCQHFCWDSRLIISKKCVATPIFLCGFQ